MRKNLARLAVVVAIAALACAIALFLSHSTGKADDFFYDSFYRLRPPADMRNADVVLVAVDEPSLKASGKGWPWPRTYWSDISRYLDSAGAKVIAFDITFEQPSPFGDDQPFAEAMNQLHTPLIFGSDVEPDGSWNTFAPPIKDPVFGAVNLGNDIVYRAYPPELNGQSSLAEAILIQSHGDLKMVMDHLDEPFLLHYYGPHVRADGTQTFHFVPAYNVWYAQKNGPEGAAKAGVSPDLFKGKIVIVGAIARGTFDLKSTPYSNEYPGPEIQATAIENILRQQQVHVLPASRTWLLAALAALAVAAGIVFPRRASIKIAVPLLVAAAVMALCIALFRGTSIQWLSPVKPLIALLAASPLAFGYTYFSEDRQRRFMLKALSKVVSPAVAEELSRNPGRLALGTVRTDITILFTDVAGFTDLSEGMDVQDLGKFINRYLGEMSTRVFEQDGTLDKYIGDAVMAFWNAPISQADHAVRACRAALAMIAREHALQSEFAALGAKKVFTRIGIHTATAAVGFIGSEHLFNYTAMGDGVNLASRMEGANKIYGTQILITEPTALLVKEHFHLRRIDVLRVKGKQIPMPVYELIGERSWHRRPADGSEARTAAIADQLRNSARPEHRQDADATTQRIQLYEQAFTAYQSRDWAAADKLLLELSRLFGEDGPTQVLRDRISEFRQNPPPPNWDGVHVSKTK